MNTENIKNIDSRVRTNANAIVGITESVKANATNINTVNNRVTEVSKQVNTNTQSIATVTNQVNDNTKLTKAVGAIALENNERINVMGLQVNKNTADISTLAEAANYSLRASALTMQDHETIEQHTAQIQDNSRRISSVEREVKTVGASAAALAALKPIEYHEGQKAQIMAAVGTYKGKTATALGVAHYANPDLLFHAGAAYDGDNGVMANAGVTIGIGSAPTAPSKPASPATVKVLEDKVASLEAQNKEIKEVLEKVLAANPQVAKKTTK